MNTKKSVYNRLFSKEEKTELESQKVELNLISDFKVLYKASQLHKKMSETNKKEAAFVNKNAKQVVNKQIEIEKKAIELEKKAESLYKEFQNKAKDLGINPKNTDTFKLYNDLLGELLLVASEKNIKSIINMSL